MTPPTSFKPINPHPIWKITSICLLMFSLGYLTCWLETMLTLQSENRLKNQVRNLTLEIISQGVSQGVFTVDYEKIAELKQENHIDDTENSGK